MAKVNYDEVWGNGISYAKRASERVIKSKYKTETGWCAETKTNFRMKLEMYFIDFVECKFVET